MRQNQLDWIYRVKILILVVVIFLGMSSAGWAADLAPLTNLHAIIALTNAEAREAQPVAFEATVVYFRGYENVMYVQDGDDAIFVLVTSNQPLVGGDRVLVKGTMQASFRPIVVASAVTLLHHRTPPKSVPATFEDLIQAKDDCKLVTVRAVVRAADLVVSNTEPPVASARLQMVTKGGRFQAYLDSDDENALKDLLDAEVEITGADSGIFDDKMQQTGVALYVSSLAEIRILKRAIASPWSLPVTPMDRILAGYHVNDLTARIRVHGIITYYQPDSAIVLQDGTKSLWIETHTREPLQIGDEADASGFPHARERLLTLTDGEVQDRHVFQPVTPLLATWQQLGSRSYSRSGGHQNDLVSIEGKVVTWVREATQDEYVLDSDGGLFTAIYHHQPAPGVLPPMKEIPLGSRIRVTGICSVESSDQIVASEKMPFNILLRSFDDIAVIARPSLLNIRNLLYVVGLLLLVVIGAGVRAWTLERNVRRHTAALAALERRRSRILEDINGARPLAEIVEEIAELVSFTLNGAPCWCQIANGARLGNCTAKLTGLSIVQEQIPSRSGPPLGTLFAALDPLSEPKANESEALSMGTGLATLAIETRKLYSDLLRRSEFDLLTDIHNRFSLEKRLDTQIEEARQNAGIFGLIYIDIDEFKQVNDQYGHHIGDLFLQEATRRMKLQLRSHDLLARLGGDEFAVLLPMVRNRADVEEISQRLEHCFVAPLVLEENLLKGSASFGIAVYPEDGATKDKLLRVADAAMYTAKALNKQLGSHLERRGKPL
jgi:diguanylate cyclase (GGDEF)-like protein